MDWFFPSILSVAQSKPCPILSCDTFGSWLVFFSFLHSECYMGSLPLFSEMFFVQLTGSRGPRSFFRLIARTPSWASLFQCFMETWEPDVSLWSENVTGPNPSSWEVEEITSSHSWVELGFKPRQHGVRSTGLGQYAMALQKLGTGNQLIRAWLWGKHYEEPPSSTNLSLGFLHDR